MRSSAPNSMKRTAQRKFSSHAVLLGAGVIQQNPRFRSTQHPLCGSDGSYMTSGGKSVAGSFAGPASRVLSAGRFWGYVVLLEWLGGASVLLRWLRRGSRVRSRSFNFGISSLCSDTRSILRHMLRPTMHVLDRASEILEPGIDLSHLSCKLALVLSEGHHLVV